MDDSQPQDMENERALLTDSRRRVLRGEDDDIRDGRVYEDKSRIRNILHESLPEDVQIFIEHHPDLYVELVEEVLTDEGLSALQEEDPELFDDLQDKFCAEY